MTYLRVSVFVAGAAVMGAEMSAPRLLAPFFGASQVVWTNTIGAILAAMTLGAYAGGRLADRWPYEKAFARALLASGAALAAVPFVSRPFLNYAAQALARQEAGPFVLSLISVSLFFAPPAFALAMISPWAVKIAAAAGNHNEIGRVAGELAALGALGSIAGTFAATFVLLPLLGTRSTILALAAVLILTGGLRAFKKIGEAYGEEDKYCRKEEAEEKQAVPGGAQKKDGDQNGKDLSEAADEERSSAGMILIALICAALPIAGAGPVNPVPGLLFESDSPYQYVQVVKDKKGYTLLCLNEGVSEHSVLPPSGYLTGGCWDYMSALPALNTRPGGPLRALILGLAGGTIARQLEHFYGPSRALAVDGVEIDPAVIEAGRRHFGLASLKSLRVHEADARSFARAAGGPYDIIIADAFRQPYIPFHMATREFFGDCRRLLSDRGLMALNFASARTDDALAASIAATFKTVFENTYIFTVPNRSAPFDNLIIIGSPSPLSPSDAAGFVPPGLAPALAKMRKTWRSPEPPPSSMIFTDDHAPVEFFTELMILRGALSGTVR